MSLVLQNASECKQRDAMIGDKVSVRRETDIGMIDIIGEVVSWSAAYYVVKTTDGQLLTCLKKHIHFRISDKIWAIACENDHKVTNYFLANEEGPAREIWNAIQAQIMEGSLGPVTVGDVPAAIPQKPT